MTTALPLPVISTARHPGTPGALQRVANGAAVGADDAEILLQARASDLDALLDLAGALRDRGLDAVGRSGVITYSRKVFLPITNLCRDRCHYCIFVESPGQLARQGKSLYMSAEQILAVARQGAASKLDFTVSAHLSISALCSPFALTLGMRNRSSNSLKKRSLFWSKYSFHVFM